MFTWIIEEIGTVLAARPEGEGARLTVRAPIAASDAEHGASIAVGGVCLTVVGSGADWFDADVMSETLASSTAGDWAPGRLVNIERALRADARLGGHIVQGHVDGVAEVTRVAPGEGWRVVRLALPAALAPLASSKPRSSRPSNAPVISACCPIPSTTADKRGRARAPGDLLWPALPSD